MQQLEAFEQQATDATQTGRILVVEQESTRFGGAVALLEDVGYSVSTAVGAEQALLHLQNDPGCNLVLSDVIAADGDGLALLDIICRDYPNVPVVIATGINDAQVAASAFRRGATDYLLKPLGRGELIAAIDRALEHGQLLKQNAAYRHNLEQVMSLRTGRLRQTMQELELSYALTLEAMGDALDLRDTETEGHSRRVTAYTIALTREIGLAEDEIRTIARGAFLHDIGKIATPDRILLKPGKLDPEETAIMREHCARGYQMVRKIPFLRQAAELVYAHQERFDGTGYPRGLSGESIPLGARIFAIADTIDAITSDRPYRQRRSFDEATSEVMLCSGSQFDPKIVKTFSKMDRHLWSDLRSKVETAGAGGMDLLRQ